MRRWIYGAGCPEGNEKVYIKRFEDHNKEVMEYFIDRSEDLLILNFSEGDGWDKLCHFLNKKTPSTLFPHVNKASAREKVKINKASDQGKMGVWINRLKRKISQFAKRDD
jgi:hypothetical protein